jgi:hypothetical protein
MRNVRGHVQTTPAPTRRRAGKRGRRRIALVAVPCAAGALALSAVALAASSGQYGGTTGQASGGVHERISFTVSHGTLSGLQVNAIVAQGGGDCAVLDQEGSTFQFNRSLKITHDAFSGTLKDNLKDSIAIQGHFKGTTASGSFVITGDDGTVQALICNSGTIKFTAELAGGELKDIKYSGSSGPGFPISFRVSGSGKVVDNLVVLFNETCTPGAGNSEETFKFSPVKIVAGSFSTSAVTMKSGGTVSESMRVKGTFFGRTAVGTVSDHVSIPGLMPCTETVPFMATAK